MNLIVANSINGVIGKNGVIPWNIPEDLKRFRRLTMGSIVIMGRKTYESIGKPLEGRYNLVISKSRLNVSGVHQFTDIASALSFAKDIKPNGDIFVIGGASIYKQFMEQKLVNKIYQTVVNKSVDGDAFFNFNEEEWEVVGHKDFGEFSYITWEKVKNKL